jgi:hypothetical protein
MNREGRTVGGPCRYATHLPGGVVFALLTRATALFFSVSAFAQGTTGTSAGTGAQVWTHGQQERIPSETRLDFTLEQPVEITYIPGRRSQRRLNAEQASSYE